MTPTLSPKKRALRLARIFETNLAEGHVKDSSSYFEYMNLCDLINAYERKDITEVMLLAKVQELEGQA